MRALAVIGNVNPDLVLGPAYPWPLPGTEVLVEHSELRVGGAAGNTALAWKAMGVPFQIAANAGSDQFGAWLLETFGPWAERWSIHQGPTTISVRVTHPDGERTFFTAAGHVDHLEVDDVCSGLDGEQLAGGIALLTGGFVTKALSSEYPKFLAWARAQNISVALDTGWPSEGWTESKKAAALSWLGESQIALLNEIEATSLTSTDSAVAAAGALRDVMPSDAIIVVKCGSRGALAITPEQLISQVSAERVAVVDTIGAGDVFNAGFLSALAMGRRLEDCLLQGVSVATTAISTRPRTYEKTGV
ncbi:PfkB family carbohydrate kinase [Rhizobium sp. BE258]|uniref:carbohydrate kinase family protein n=1 Tax=Rhizobium sp. BE258 TaxID=2817722 RepID=UPI0028563446|nr:PfkB family carbohydrate kinase [Rhizobium sp. BE258]MDR7144754.1 sugar/nucleoside kinase (ribokinase family) [Rhizobium sp. BE258]